MTILIDGYNLLHAAGIIPRGSGAGTLERARGALLNWLVSNLEPQQVLETTVVFDAANPPPGLPRRINHQGLTVLFSTDHEDADALLEELIRQDAVPKRLVVVSSDHRVQRAARRRRSIAVDSDDWYFALRQRRHGPAMEPLLETKPVDPLSAAEVQHWLDEFSELIDDLDQLDARPGRLVPPTAAADTPARGAGQSDLKTGTSSPDVAPRDVPTGDVPTGDAAADDADLANPFPPGYGEDLLRPDANLDEL